MKQKKKKRRCDYYSDQYWRYENEMIVEMMKNDEIQAEAEEQVVMQRAEMHMIGEDAAAVDYDG